MIPLQPFTKTGEPAESKLRSQGGPAEVTLNEEHFLFSAGKHARKIRRNETFAFFRNRAGDQDFFERTALLDLPQTDAKKAELFGRETVGFFEEDQTARRRHADIQR